MNRLPTEICGIGAVTGYGWGREQLWDGLSSGVSAVQLHDGYGEALGDKIWVARVLRRRI